MCNPIAGNSFNRCRRTGLMPSACCFLLYRFKTKLMRNRFKNFAASCSCVDFMDG